MQLWNVSKWYKGSYKFDNKECNKHLNKRMSIIVKLNLLHSAFVTLSVKSNKCNSSLEKSIKLISGWNNFQALGLYLGNINSWSDSGFKQTAKFVYDMHNEKLFIHLIKSNYNVKHIKQYKLQTRECIFIKQVITIYTDIFK